MSGKVVHTAGITSEELLEPTQDLLDEKVTYDVTFSDTKTRHWMLRDLFE